MKTRFAPMLLLLLGTAWGQKGPPYAAELLFPLESWHNHSSSVVEMPGGGLFVVWFHGSGERRSDDVLIRGSRLASGAQTWEAPFEVADQPDFPDTNCTLFVDSRQRLWLFWPTILANEWHTALMNYRVSTNYRQPGPPAWDFGGNLLLKHDLERFEQKVRAFVEPDLPKVTEPRLKAWMERLLEKSGDKFFSRLGWMTRTHPIQLATGRIIVPLYSDGYSFSLMAISDDLGQTWRASEPLVGYGSIQPSVVVRKDGSLVAYMRDAGPAPKRIQTSVSDDQGLTWSPVVDTQIPNPGSSCEAIVLKDGRWILVYNDTERGRHSLAVALSEDEGATWRWERHLDLSEPGLGSFHYPSVIQARDGAIHVTYSYFVRDAADAAWRKSIKHARFNVAWILEGDPQ